MNPEDIKKISEQVKDSIGGFGLLYRVLAPILSGIIAYFVSYINEKAKFRAQKEEIEYVTKLVEEVKTEIALLAKKHEIHYSYYFQKKAEVLALVYSRLRAIHRDLRKAAEESLDPETTKERWFRSRDALWAFSELLDDNRIFVDEKIEKDLDGILHRLFEILQITGHSRNLPDAQVELKNGLIFTALTELGHPMQNALDELKVSFRNHISAPSSEEEAH